MCMANIESVKFESYKMCNTFVGYIEKSLYTFTVTNRHTYTHPLSNIKQIDIHL